MEISGTTARELQLLQDGFAGLVKLSLVITDADGCTITAPSSPPDHHGQFEAEILYLLMARAADFADTDSVLIIDAPYSPIAGIKYIFAPIQVEADTYFLWAGPILAKGRKEEAMEQLSPELAHFKKELAGMAEISAEETALRLQKVEEIKQYIGKKLELETRQRQTQQHYQSIEKLVSEIGGKDFYDHAADHFLKNNSAMSFFGYAKISGPFQYKITSLFGDYDECLIDQTFLPGEGLLGQAAASGQFKVWNDLTGDLRGAIFSKSNQLLRSFFCFHVNQAETVVFGGSYQRRIGPELTRILRIMHSLFLHYESKLHLQQDLSKAQTQLNILKDLSLILSDIKDVNRVLYILMDMSMNLAAASFACVYLHQSEKDGQARMLSRGLRPEQISSYGTRLRKKFFEKDASAYVQMETAFIDMPWQETAFECPLLRDDEIIGVFAVAVTDEEKYEEFSPLLTSFAQLAGFALKLLIPEKTAGTEEEKINLLFRATEYFNRAAFQRISDAKQILHDFLSFLGADEGTSYHCGQALLMTAYRADFLESQNFSQQIVQIVNDFYLLQEEGHVAPVSRESQILYLVLTYLFYDRKGSTVDPEGLDPRLIGQFEAFLLKTEAQETIFSDEASEKEVLVRPDLSRIKTQFHLSEREEEVLVFIIKGSNNKEIADQLYISEHTVKNHLTNIFRKLNVKDRTQAIAKCYAWAR